MMPKKRPDTTVPTTWPRRASGARWPAKGTITCTRLALRPITSDAPRKIAAVGATKAAASAATSTAIMARIRPLFSTVSPSGTASTRPIA